MSGVSQQEMANTLDSSKYVYYNYVIADNSLVPYVDCNDSLQSQPHEDVENAMPIAAVADDTTTTTKATTTTSSFPTNAQQQYPMLVQQCITDHNDITIINEMEDTFETEVNTDAQNHTLNVDMTETLDEETAPNLSVTMKSSATEDFEELDEEEEDDDEDDFEYDADDCEEPDYESEQELTNLAWLSDPTRSGAMNMLAVAAVDADDDEDDNDRVNNNMNNNTITVAHKAVSTEVSKTSAEAIKVREPMRAKIDRAKNQNEENLRKSVNDKNVTQERFNKFMQQVQQ